MMRFAKGHMETWAERLARELGCHLSVTEAIDQRLTAIEQRQTAIEERLVEQGAVATDERK